MSDLLTDARETLADISSRRPGQTHYEGCRTEHVDCLLADLIQEVERLRLTDAEREAIDWAARMASRERDTAADAASRGYKPEGGGDPAQWAKAHGERAATLRGLLERSEHP